MLRGIYLCWRCSVLAPKGSHPVALVRRPELQNCMHACRVCRHLFGFTRLVRRCYVRSFLLGGRSPRLSPVMVHAHSSSIVPVDLAISTPHRSHPQVQLLGLYVFYRCASSYRCMFVYLSTNIALHFHHKQACPFLRPIELCLGHPAYHQQCICRMSSARLERYHLSDPQRRCWHGNFLRGCLHIDCLGQQRTQALLEDLLMVPITRSISA